MAAEREAPSYMSCKYHFGTLKAALERSATATGSTTALPESGEKKFSECTAYWFKRSPVGFQRASK